MDRKEYIRNSCGITAKKITPYNRDMDNGLPTPRLTTAEKKAVRVRLKSLQPTPKMTTAEKNALTAAAGMIVFDTTLSKYSGYDGSAWVQFT